MPKTVDFNYHIKPILSDRCFACHGPDENAREADLMLHTEQALFAPIDSSGDQYVVRPGNLVQSAIYDRIISDDPDYVMPPPSSNLSLDSYEKALIKRWIEQGAKWKDHWAFIAPSRPDIPKLGKKHVVHNSIDGLVIEQLSGTNLKPSELAEPSKLLRRVYFDLIGLPPTLAVVQRFSADPSQEHYLRIVDDLLETPQYGERMASLWLDVSRYADSHGYQDDRQRTVWPWRDWVVNAFNDNLSYQDFVTWQLAGDLLPDASYRQKLATTFNRNHPITQEGGVINEEYLNEYAADRVQTFSTAFLGLTMECARCHDHKYDPLSQEDFYELYGFFNNVKDEKGKISYFDLAPAPNIKMQDEEYEQHIERVKHTILHLEDELEKIGDREQEFFESWKQNNASDISASKESLQAHMPMESEGWLFTDLARPGEFAKVNINLPPSIPRPEKVSGRKGGALSFNGENFLSLGEIGDFDWHHDFSMGAYILHTAKHRKTAGILSRRNGELYRQGYDLSLTPENRLTFRLIHSMRNEYLEVQTQREITAHKWHHVIVSYDGSGKAKGVRLFINGERQGTRIIRDSLKHQSILNGNDLLAGHWNHRARELDDLYGFKGGKIDEVILYNRALSDLEIKSIYRGQPVKSTNEKSLFDHYLLNHSVGFKETKEQLDSFRAIDLHLPEIPIMQEADTIKSAFVLARGAYDAPVKKVSRATPEAVLPLSPNLDKNRLGLAQWLFDDQHPLTSRVMVNRLWQMCFGRGLVKTLEDFGSQGDLPSHPALLDWLSVEFRESGWNIKHVLKLIVSSATYQQSARMNAQSLQRDPENILLSRGPHKPLTAEMIRDQALAVSGLLDRRLGGKWVKPYQPAGIWKEMANQIGENKYRHSSGSNLYRRSLYTYWKRTIPPPTMLTFDAPERTICSVKRQSTSTPLQALVLMNDPTYIESSRTLVQQLLLDEDRQVPTSISEAFNQITAREPSSEEMKTLEYLFQQMKDHYSEQKDEASMLLQTGASKAPISKDASNLAAMTMVVSTIFNLDEVKHN
ncbi:MAG: DUF1553 domain-containing protein [Saprospiraceae bacterium]|nr:DUF1553 domain-containing protein [Saprospiraceae bacterium]